MLLFLLKNGKIVEIGSGVQIPENSLVIDYGKKVVYPAFIELNSSYGLPPVQPKKEETKNRMAEDAYYWNPAIRVETNPVNHFEQNAKAATSLQKTGFAYANICIEDGIFRGNTNLVKIDSTLNVRESILESNNAWAMSFKRGKTGASYPSSLMGAIALLRQFYYDAAYAEHNPTKGDAALSLFNANKTKPAFFEITDVWDIARAEKIAKEFGLTYHYFLKGFEFERLDVLKETNPNSYFILPLEFPKPYNIQGPYESDELNLQSLKRWYQSPFAASMLFQEKIPFALTSNGLKPADFIKNLRKAIEMGLPEAEALRALTQTPAKILGNNLVGSLAKGNEASFFVATENIFKKGEILETWVNGKQFKFIDESEKNLEGKYNLTVAGNAFKLIVKKKGNKTEAEIKIDSSTVKPSILLEKSIVSLSFVNPRDSVLYSLSGQIYSEGVLWEGKGFSSKDKSVNWGAIKDKQSEKASSKAKIDSTESKPSPLMLQYPNKAYGFNEVQKSDNVLIRNATLWTNEEEGILQETDILVLNGKIANIGKKLPEPLIKGKPIENLKIIDARGKIVTAGIVDEHSHIAIARGVNEGSQYISSEVSIADVVNPDDINIYRQLAGGVTSVQLLHGSANPIGGKSALIKLKWGETAENMLIPNAPGFIKFALGENVKQSNWGSRANPRYPQTRMGVEQVYYDAFYRAKAYQEAKVLGNSKKGSAKKNKETGFRTDLELETLVEILNGERHISCHSYVQSEINMLMKVADSLGFKVQTFTHVLEGYKIPEKLLAHGASASTFADWWAYKFEVNDAIPYNAFLLNQFGVNTCINSDDAEMGRRLYMEAAKSQMYGGMSAEEAFKMVSLNPAKALKIDDRTGSLKIGKDADLVIWSNDPTSIYTKVEKTFIDGVLYFDLKTDTENREKIRTMRNKLLALMLKEIEGGSKTQPVKAQKVKHIHCDYIEDYE